MSQPIVYIDRSEIREGKLEQLKAAIKELVDFVYANEPQLISYSFYFNDSATQMTLVAIHPDSASMEFHMKVAGPAFRKFVDFIDLSAIEVYGPLNDAVLQQLRRKAQMLGRGAVHVHTLQAGFSRSASGGPRVGAAAR